ncbi:MAG: methionine--tRNA ligase, partial [Rhodobacteraceae bacterium]|nr:methionine--tRNA ligase [Paracoccaceae bacterium]
MQRVLITSALPYINGIKHLGNLVGSQLPADLYARYLRQRGVEVMFICATDEHGTPAELAASKAGMSVEAYCADMYTTQKTLAEGFLLSFDYFGRSSSRRNHALTQHFAARLADNDLIEEREDRQIYSVAEERFLPDRYVRGTCPACGYDRARGDQCENCTKQLDPEDLINPMSEVSGSTDLEMRKTRHLYLRQSALRSDLDAWITSQTDWPVLTTSIARKWLHDGDGLRDRGITRDLDWGIPVRRGSDPWPGMENKVFYVWFDAPIEYIAATAEWADANELADADWERWWRTDRGAEDVRYVQFMGKDNVPFHTLSFPTTLLGSGEPWKLVDYIKSFNYLNYDGGQFSTSLKRGIFMDQALDILPADYWRWWLLSHAPEHADSEFTWDNFAETINTDLANVLGNFISRVAGFCRNHFDSRVPPQGQWGPDEQGAIRQLQHGLLDYQNSMEAIQVRKSAQRLRHLWTIGNEYIQHTKPWIAIRDDPDRAATIIAFALNLARFYGVISTPFIPGAAGRILDGLGCKAAIPWPTS